MSNCGKPRSTRRVFKETNSLKQFSRTRSPLSFTKYLLAARSRHVPLWSRFSDAPAAGDSEDVLAVALLVGGLRIRWGPERAYNPSVAAFECSHTLGFLALDPGPPLFLVFGRLELCHRRLFLLLEARQASPGCCGSQNRFPWLRFGPRLATKASRRAASCCAVKVRRTFAISAAASWLQRSLSPCPKHARRVCPYP